MLSIQYNSKKSKYFFYHIFCGFHVEITQSETLQAYVTESHDHWSDYVSLESVITRVYIIT